MTIIDGQTNSVITTIYVENEPRALVWNSTNNKIYCTNYGSNNVTVIDGQTNSVITTVTVGSYPFALVWNPQNNKIYCTIFESGIVTVIDGQTNSVITTITVGSSPFALVWNSQNNKVYCANANSNNVTVIDGQTNSVITTISVGSGPWAFCWNSIQNRVYVANYNSSSISVIRDVMGIEENEIASASARNDFVVYPNPAKTYLTIRFSQTADCSQIKIFDVMGKIVKEIAKVRDGQRNDRVVRVSLDGIKNGVYFIQVGNELITKKLIVTK